jgi:hypothetical protein
VAGDPSLANGGQAGFRVDLDTIPATASLSSPCVSPANGPFTYAWSLASSSAGSGAFITNPSGIPGSVSPPSFTPVVPGTYQVQLLLTDTGGFSSIATKIFTIGNCTSNPSLSATSGPAVINWNATSPDAATSLTNLQINRGDRVQLFVPAANITAGACGSANNTSYTFQWALVGKPAGSTATLSSTTDAQPVFFPDVANGAYQFLVTVRDSLGNSVTSGSPQKVGLNKSSQLVGVSDCGVRVPTAPSFTIGNLVPNSFQSVTLNASATIDPEQVGSGSFTACPSRFSNAAYMYFWSANPAAGVTFDSSTSITHFVASRPGNYVISLVVVGNTDSVPSFPNAGPAPIVVNQCGANPPIAGNFTATQSYLDNVSTIFSNNATTLANNVPVQVNVTVTDADSTCGGVLPPTDSFTIRWTLLPPVASQATLTNSTTTAPRFTPDVAGAYLLAETATDSNGDSNSQLFTLTTGNCGTLKPTVTNLAAKQVVNGITVVFSASTPQYMELGLPIQLDPTVANVNDPVICAHPVATTSFAWSFLSIPAGSAASMLGASTFEASFVPDVATTIPTASPATFYTVQLVATDSFGHTSISNPLAITAICGASAPHLNTETATSGSFWASQSVALTSSTLTITHSSVATDTTAPHAEAFGNVSFYQGFPVQLFTANSDNDAPAGCGTAFPAETTSYSWTLVSLPSGSRATLNNPSAANPSFVPDVPGDYDLQLVLTDSVGKSSGPIALGTISGAATLPIPNPSATGSTAGTTTHVIHVEACGGGTPTAKIAVGGPVAAAPGASATGQPFNNPTLVTVDASQSTNSDNVPLDTGVSPASGCGLSRPLSFNWSYTSLPLGSGTTITSPGLVSPILSLNVAGTYGLALDVTSGGKTSRATLSLGAATAKSFVGVAGTNHALYTAIATDPTSGNPVAAFLDGDTGDIHVQRCTSGCATSSPTWSGTSIPDVDVLGPDPFITPSLDEDPRPLDIKVGSDGTIFVAYGTGPSTPTAGHTTVACSAYLASFGPTATSWTYATIRTATNVPPPFGGTVGCSNADTFTGSSFSNPLLFPSTLIGTATQEGRWLSLALDPTSSQPRVVFEDQFATLFCTAPAFGSCTPPPASPSSRTPVYLTCTLAAGPSLSCTAPVSIAAGGSAMSGRWPSLKIDGSGFADAAFYVDSAGTGFAATSLAYTTNSSGSFVAVQVDSGGDVGRFASLDLAKPNTLGNNTSNFAPRIAYLDKGATNGAVKLASIIDGAASFSNTVVDTGIDPSSAGESIALVIDPASGSPRIAYRATGNLKFASSASLTSNFQFLTPTATGGAGISMALTPLGGFRISYQGNSGNPQLEVQAIGQ